MKETEEESALTSAFVSLWGSISLSVLPRVKTGRQAQGNTEKPFLLMA